MRRKENVLFLQKKYYNYRPHCCLIMKINCLVVTYNRLDLLKENLESLRCQSFPINKIVIVDNCSTDGTASFLEKYRDNPNYVIVRTDKNIGGAGGFSLGLKESVKQGCDYTWMMDDDTIPHNSALEELVKVVQQKQNVGFVCSRVNWVDGNLHVMNKPDLLGKSEADDVVDCVSCSFVSVMVSTKAVYKVGLPIKEFFIWCDDTEYTSRISDAGYSCYYVKNSIVLHKTGTNYSFQIDLAPANVAWRFYYQARNTCYLKRRKKSFKLFLYIYVLNKYRKKLRKLKRRRDGARKEFRDAVKRGCMDGLTFNPPIEYVDSSFNQPL